MRSVFGFSGAYADATGRETAFFTSRRRGKPVTRLWGDPAVEAFSYEKTHARLPRDAWRDLPYGTRHNPQNDPSATIRAMDKYGALYI